jgi:hypothetical protein
VAIKIGVILPVSTPDPSHPIIGDVRASARLATAAAVTERITIGFGVMLLALRPVPAGSGTTSWQRSCSPPCSRWNYVHRAPRRAAV